MEEILPFTVDLQDQGERGGGGGGRVEGEVEGRERGRRGRKRKVIYIGMQKGMKWGQQRW